MIYIYEIELFADVKLPIWPLLKEITWVVLNKLLYWKDIWKLKI